MQDNLQQDNPFSTTHPLLRLYSGFGAEADATAGNWGGGSHHLNKDKGVTFIVPLLCASHQVE